MDSIPAPAPAPMETPQPQQPPPLQPQQQSSLTDRPLRFGAVGADDSKRSPDEVRLIVEMAREDVEAFLAANPTLDGNACDQLRREPPHIQLAVLERGPLRHCREPSGVVITRIRMARNGTLGGPSDRAPKFQATGETPQRTPVDGGQEKKELKVNKMFVGALIGKGGEIVKAMNAEAGCKIGIDQKDEASDEATVIIGPGTPEQLAIGERLVMARVNARVQEIDAKGAGKGKFGPGKGAFMGNQPLMLGDQGAWNGGDMYGGGKGGFGGGYSPPGGPGMQPQAGQGIPPPAGMGGAGPGGCNVAGSYPEQTIKSAGDQALNNEAFAVLQALNNS